MAILEGENAVAKNRKLMGSKDPNQAELDTIRAAYGESIEANLVHESDSIENAKLEVNFFLIFFLNMQYFENFLHLVS